MHQLVDCMKFFGGTFEYTTVLHENLMQINRQ